MSTQKKTPSTNAKVVSQNLSFAVMNRYKSIVGRIIRLITLKGHGPRMRGRGLKIGQVALITSRMGRIINCFFT